MDVSLLSMKEDMRYLIMFFLPLFFFFASCLAFLSGVISPAFLILPGLLTGRSCSMLERNLLPRSIDP